MSTLYLIALGAVCATLVGLVLEAMVRVSRKPVWHAYRPTYAAPEAPGIRVDQALGPMPALVAPIAVLAVDERHSGFVGLTNAEEFELTA